eukprot:GHUV01027211.1.p1 GENE.GHUV01027211.1~~GHUV01027211.1.p1  ORF type:complete len:161 (+),score=46.01 GHUV01027211.1:110-592(+)
MPLLIGTGNDAASPCRPDAAAAAKLIVVPAGPADAARRVLPFLAAHGRLLPTQDVPFKANVMKLTGNFMLFGFVNTMCEALTLSDKNDIPRDDILAFIEAFFPAPSIQGYAKRMATESLDAGAGFTGKYSAVGVAGSTDCCLLDGCLSEPWSTQWDSGVA